MIKKLSNIFIVCFLLIFSATKAQVIISVDVKKEIKTLHGKEIGINLNYLMDDAYLSGMSYKSTINTLKTTGVKLLRYPGGEKSDNYLFSKPPYDKAIPSAAYCNWPATESRFFESDKTAKSLVLDFDEYMVMCQQLRAEPFVVVAYDCMYSTSTCGTIPTRAELIKNAMEWVRYANIKNNYNVKLWMIGNESWNEPGYNGKVTPQQYAQDIAQFADSMRSIDPTIKIIANGNDKFWRTLLQSDASAKVDYLALSNYLPWKIITSYDTYIKSTGELNLETKQAIDSINTFAKASDKNRLQVILSEYNSLDWTKGWTSANNLGHAICNFQQMADATINPQVYASCLWNTRWVNRKNESKSLVDAFDANGNLNATGLIISIFGNNLLKSMVETFSTKSYIKVYATYDKHNKYLNVFVINKSTSEQLIKLNISNFFSSFKYQLWNFTGKGIEDENPEFKKNGEINKGFSGMNCLLPPNSISMIQIR